MRELRTYNIEVNDCRTSYDARAGGTIICGNPFKLKFIFDAEWYDYANTPKTAKIKFKYRGANKHLLIEFIGDTCTVPSLFGITQIEVGVFIDDDICTTGGAIINCEKSIRCDTSTNALGADALDNVLETLKGTSIFVRYSHYADGTDFSNEWDNDQKYIGIANAYSAPADKSGYEWAQIISGTPALKPPKSATTDSRGKTVTVENHDAPFVIKNKVYLDGEEVATVEDGESADFSAYVGDKITANVEVTAICEGYKESEPVTTEWGLTNGDADLEYEFNGETYTLTHIPPDRSRYATVASYVEGKPMTDVYSAVKFTASGYTYYGGIDFLGDLVSITKSFIGCGIERLYISRVDNVVDSFQSVQWDGRIHEIYIDRLYSYDNLPTEITDVVTELSGTASNAFKRINTWCIGVGTDGVREFAIKEDGTARVTYNSSEHSSTEDIDRIPDVFNGMPVNGVGKFYRYNDDSVSGVVFGDNMEDINDSAFRNCSKIADIRFGKGLKSIGEHAFRYSGISCLDFSGCPNLETIKGRAFSNNSSLTTVFLPSSVQSIASTAFASCSKLTDIYVPWDEGEGPSGAPWGATAATVHYNSI